MVKYTLSGLETGIHRDRIFLFGYTAEIKKVTLNPGGTTYPQSKSMKKLSLTELSDVRSRGLHVIKKLGKRDLSPSFKPVFLGN